MRDISENMKNYIQTFDDEIDLVYLWVDGSDVEWLAAKNSFLGKVDNAEEEAVSVARNADNHELKYSLRSVEMHAPWIHRVFIVTDGQRPDWLNMRHEKIRIVDIRELLPEEALPCYNSVIIEHFLYKIPGLSEHFLYANDDMFFNEPVEPDFFFTVDGRPIVRLQRVVGGKLINQFRKVFGIHINIYRKTIEKAALLVEEKYGKYYSGTPHHNIDAYLKADYEETSEIVFGKEIKSTLKNHIRSKDDIQRIIYLYYLLAIGHAQLRYVNRGESCRIRIHKPEYQYFIDKYHPILFCLNDSHHATDTDRARVEPFLRKLFPEKSSFEK